jgi:TonB family protein
MHGRKIAWWMLIAWTLILVLPAIDQQGKGSVLHPRKSVTKPMKPTLLVFCDLQCDWRLDGDVMGDIDVGGNAKSIVALGQHLVVAGTKNGIDRIKKEIEIKVVGQTDVKFALRAVRDARIKAEQTPQKNNQKDEPEVDVVPSIKLPISAVVAQGMLLEKTIPDYPAVAKAMGITGTVVLKGTISKAGFLKDLDILSGPPMLRQSALDAVKHWRYRPYLVNNEPVEAVTTINVIFSLNIK